MRWIKAVLKGIAIVSFVVFSACATKVVGLQSDPSFTYKEVVEKRMAVGGVIHTFSVLNNHERLLYSDIIRSRFSEQRPGYFVYSIGVIVERLGKESYSAMIEEYRTLGTVSDKWLSTIAEFTDGFGYVIFARIIEDSTKSERTRSDNYDDEKKRLLGYTITAERKRTMTVAVDIYSLKTKTEVWGGTVTKSASESKSYKHDTRNAASTVIEVLGSIMKPEERRFPYPSMPTQAQVLRSIFSGFGENLPEPGK